MFSGWEKPKIFIRISAQINTEKKGHMQGRTYILCFPFQQIEVSNQNGNFIKSGSTLFR